MKDNTGTVILGAMFIFVLVVSLIQDDELKVRQKTIDNLTIENDSLKAENDSLTNVIFIKDAYFDFLSINIDSAIRTDIYKNEKK